MHTSLIKASEKFYNEHKRYCFVTPNCFIDLLKTFAKMFESRKTDYLVILNSVNFFSVIYKAVTKKLFIGKSNKIEKWSSKVV